MPTTRGMKQNKFPSDTHYTNEFGSFKQALIEADLMKYRKDIHQFDRVSLTNREMLELLVEFLNENNRPPTELEMSILEMPNLGTYITRFGSMKNALDKTTFDMEKYKEKLDRQTKACMIGQYFLIDEELERVPNSRDIEYYSRNFDGFYSMSTYENHFGSLSKLQKLCGMEITVVKNKTRDELLDDLKTIGLELSRTPYKEDLNNFNGMASYSKYNHEFGSFNSALIEAGFNVKGKKEYYTENGSRCISALECLFLNMLEKKSIEYKQEIPYKEVIDTNRKYRFDCSIEKEGKTIYIEIFGIIHREEYLKTKEDKIKMCKENNIKLIHFDYYDIAKNSEEGLYSLFLEKLKNIN